ncbi:MAG: hypothetical protein N2504_03415 [candidate division WOR-3 bacterium]|nr:hypothetical protein [candidate division WOR-3 bacterium]MCX7947618.1 hypothetical protein [candidate division WOR-3 bacterium]MDW8150372.1 hypothetical protein [candidate division WOR-3 bacterium]
MIFIVCLNETWIEINTFPNRLIDLQSNISILGEKSTIISSINFWLVDSKIYSIFIGYRGFGFNLRYYDFGKFNYQSDIPSDENFLSFSPFSIYTSIGKSFQVEKNVSMGFSLGYYENRVLDEIKSSPFLSIFSNINVFERLKFMFMLENFSFKKLFSANQLELPSILSLGINLQLNKFSFISGINRYYKFEKFIGFEYGLENLALGIVYTPDYDYSKISTLFRLKYKKLTIGYKAYIPNYLNFTNTISVAYETP